MTAAARAAVCAVMALAMALMLVPAVPMEPAAAADEPAIVHEGTIGTVHWYVDSAGQLVLEPESGDVGQLPDDLGNGSMISSAGGVPWYDACRDGDKVAIGDAVTSLVVKKTVRAGSSLLGAFSYLTGLESLDLSGLDLSATTNFWGMFFHCSSLKTVDFSELAVPPTQPETMSCMFNGCASLERLDLTGWDTSTVRTFQMWLLGCSRLSWLVLPETFSTDGVTSDEYLPSLASGGVGSTGWRDPTGLADGEYCYPGQFFRVSPAWSSTALNGDSYSAYNSDLPSFDGETMAGTWTRVERGYTLSYDANGGTGDASDFPSPDEWTDDMRDTGGLVCLDWRYPRMVNECAATRDGYKFAGWNTQADGSGTTYRPFDVIPARTYSFDDEVTLYAQWEELPKLSYDANGGTGSVEPTHFEKGTKPVAAEADGLSRKGHAFASWNTKADGTGASCQPGDEVDADGDITLYAQWETASYELSYDANGGTGTVEPTGFAAGKKPKAASAEALSRDGYRFSGWNTEKDGSGTAYSPGDRVETDGNMTLYAQWVQTHTVTYDLTGAEGSIEPTVFDDGVVPCATTEMPTRDGYKFMGWSLQFIPGNHGNSSWFPPTSDSIDVIAPGGTVAYQEGVAVDSDVTLYAVWGKVCTIHFDANGGTGEAPADMTVLEYGSYSDNSGSLVYPGGAGIWYSDIDGKSLWSEDEPVYEWDSETQAIVATGETRAVNWYPRIALPDASGLSVPGYELVGWSAAAQDPSTSVSTINDRSIEPGYLPMSWHEYSSGSSDLVNMFVDRSEVTLYACWEQCQTIRYDANGGSGQPADVTYTASDLNRYRYDESTGTGTTYSTVAIDDGTSLSREHFTFAGWNLSADGSAPSPGSSTYSPTTVPGAELRAMFSYKDIPPYTGDGYPADVTLYAQWEEDPHVLFDGNGPELTADRGYFDSDGKLAESEIPVCSEEYHPELLGWATSATGSVAYTSGQLASMEDATSLAGTTLYAVWATSWTVTYDANGGAWEDGSPSRSAASYVPVPDGDGLSRVGYRFAGWGTYSGTLGNYDDPSTDTYHIQYRSPDVPDVTRDTTLYAQWAPVFTAIFDANGGTGTVPESLQGVCGEKYALPDKGDLSMEGHTFVGWAAAWGSVPSFSSYSYQEGDYLQPGDEQAFYYENNGSVIYYAIWAPTQTVHFDLNDGSRTVVDVQYFDGQTPKSPSADGLDKEHAKLREWNEYRDGSGTGRYRCDPGADLEDFYNGYTYYAQWNEDPYVTFASNGHELEGQTDVPCDSSVFGAVYDYGTGYTVAGVKVYLDDDGGFDGAVPASADPTRYRLDGWAFSTSVTSNTGRYTSERLGAMEDVSWLAGRVLYAVWAEGRAVSFDANGGEGTAPDPVMVFDQIDLCQTVPGDGLSKGGRPFVSWNTAADGSGTSSIDPWSPSRQLANVFGYQVPSSDVTLYAQYAAEGQLSLSYDLNGGSDPTGSVPAQWFSPGESVTVSRYGSYLVNGTKAFAGWNTVAEGSGTFYSGGESVTFDADTVLYAQWADSDYALTYDGNGGAWGEDGERVKAQYYVSGASVESPQYGLYGYGAWQRDGYLCTGFNTAADGSGVSYSGYDYSSSNTLVMDSDKTLYAQWARESQLVYHLNDGTGKVFFVDPGVVALGTGANSNGYVQSWTITGEKPARDGYGFIGWNSAADGSGASYSPGQTGAVPASADSDLDLYAQWGIPHYITYDTQGGSSVGRQVFYEGSPGKVTSTVPTRTGYRFLGWNAAADGAGTGYAAGDEVPDGADITLFAQWKKLHAVTHDLNYDGGPASWATTWFDDGEAAKTTTSTPSRSGWKFLGWNTAADGTGSLLAGGAEIEGVTSDTTVYAQWAEYHYATYDANGGLGGIEKQQYAPGDAPKAAEGSSLSMEHFAFSRWNTQADGSGTSYEAGADIPDDADVTLYAQWEEDPHVLFDGNGHSLSGEGKAYLASTRVSHTPNVSDSGVASGAYASNLSVNDVVTVSGASALSIEVWFSTESTSYDWLAIYPAGATPAASNFSQATVSGGKLGGGRSTSKPTSETYHKTYTVSGDTAQFYFRSDSSANYYGYYAVVTGLDENGDELAKVFPDHVPASAEPAKWALAGWNTEANGTGDAYTSAQLAAGSDASALSGKTLYAQWSMTGWEDGLESEPSDEVLDYGTYRVTIPTSIAYTGMEPGEVSTSDDYTVNVRGKVPEKKYVELAAAAGDFALSGDTAPGDSVAVQVSQGKTTWTSGEMALAPDPYEPDSPVGTDCTDNVRMTGTLSAGCEARGEVTYAAKMAAYEYKVNIQTPSHGTLVADRGGFDQGDTLTFTAMPDEGYRFSCLIVGDGDGNETEVELGNSDAVTENEDGTVTIRYTFDSYYYDDDYDMVTAVFVKVAGGFATMTDAELLAMFQDRDGYDLSAWHVGDERPVTLTGDQAGTYTMVLMDAAPYRAASNVAAPKFIWGFKELLVNTRNMNSSDTNSGGWESTTMRTYLNDASSGVYSMLPAWLKAATKRVQVISDKGYGTSGTSTYNEYLFLPAEYEVFGSASCGMTTPNSSLHQWNYYKTSGNRVKYRSGSANGWWERSSSSDYSGSFAYVVPDGEADGYYASDTLGVAVSGCI